MLAAATVTTRAPETVADFTDAEGEDLHAPWMFDSNGAAIQFPAEVIGFRVRYWPVGARGPGVLMLDEDERPLLVPRNASPEEFRTLVGYKVGRYKLAAIDRSFQFIERLPLVVEAISPAAAVRAGYRSGGDAPAAAPSLDAQTLLAFVKESNAHTQAVTAAAFEQIKDSNTRALEQIASLQRDAQESQRHTTTQLATVVGPVSGVLTAAGSSGVIKKTLALDAAAAGAPVTVQMMPSNGNEAVPRNAAGAATTTAAAAAAEKGTSMGDALLTLGLPVVEKVGAMLAYGAAKKLDVPDDYARSVAGLVQNTAQIAAKMMQPEAPPASAPAAAGEVAPPAATVGVAPRVGRELLAHVLEIQRALSEEERAWVMQQMGERQGLIDALKPSVASLTVEEGAAAVRNLRAMNAAMVTEHERFLFDRMLDPERLPQVFRRLFVDSSAEQSIAHVRQHAAQIAGMAAAKTAGAD